MSPGGSDVCQPFLIFGGAFRGRVVRLSHTVSEILDRHNDPAPVSALLAEALVAAVALAGGLKYDGVFTLQIQSNGPVGMLIADVTSNGGVRACAKFDAEQLDKELAQTRPHVLGTGHLAFTVDQGPDTERYQGIVELTGGSLSEAIHHYFRQSEQLASVVKIAVGRDAAAGENVWTASAILLQQMPEEGGEAEILAGEERDDAWRTAVILLGSVKDQELLDRTLSPERLLHRLYATVGVRALPPRPIQTRCRCSSTRSVRILASFPAEEVRNLATDGVVSMTCEFCRTVYNFTLAEIEAVAAAAEHPQEAKT